MANPQVYHGDTTFGDIPNGAHIEVHNGSLTVTGVIGENVEILQTGDESHRLTFEKGIKNYVNVNAQSDIEAVYVGAKNSLTSSEGAITITGLGDTRSIVEGSTLVAKNAITINGSSEVSILVSREGGVTVTGGLLSGPFAAEDEGNAILAKSDVSIGKAIMAASVKSLKGNVDIGAQPGVKPGTELFIDLVVFKGCEVFGHKGVSIHGNVEGSKIVSEKGDIDAKIVNNATLEAGGKVTTSEVFGASRITENKPSQGRSL